MKQPYGWYVPTEDAFYKREPGMAWKIRDRIRDGMKVVPLYRETRAKRRVVSTEKQQPKKRGLTSPRKPTKTRF